MELFNEVKNRYFQLVFTIINECSEGKAKEDILKIIDEGEFEQKVIGKNLESFSGLVLNEYGEDNNFNLLNKENGLFYPVMGNGEKLPLPVRLTNIEKAWLKAILAEPAIRLLLDECTVKKLETSLQDVDTPIKSEYIELTNISKVPDHLDDEDYIKNFRIILKAIMEEKPIRYNNTDKYGKVYENMISLPVSIEFSMRDRRFRVSMFSLNDNRPVMSNIFSMKDIHIVEDGTLTINREMAKKLLFEQKYSPEPVVLEVTDRKAAMERCFMCFSGMERSAKCLGDDKYEIKLNYYVFEEENLIRSILSLGPYVKVVSPQRIADEIVRRIKKSLDLIK